jgi:hypothetical protein
MKAAFCTTRFFTTGFFRRMTTAPDYHLSPIRQAQFLGMVAILVGLAGAGCGPSSEVRTIRNLRIAGRLDSAQAVATRYLTDHPARMDVWLEFARASLDLSRFAENEESELQPVEPLVQAGLLCGAMYQYRKQSPPRDWRDAGRLTAAEIARQMGRLGSTYRQQIRASSYAKEMLASADSTRPLQGQQLRARQSLENLRSEGRALLMWSAVLRRLLESLPEISPGSSSTAVTQLEEAQNAWIAALDLDPEYTVPVQQKARRLTDEALARTLNDLQELGYFLPPTITENGVLE